MSWYFLVLGLITLEGGPEAHPTAFTWARLSRARGPDQLIKVSGPVDLFCMRLALYVVVTSLGMSAEPGRWQTLLRKDSFAGWRSPSGHTPIEGAWTIAKGVLTAKPYVRHRTDLWTTELYENFELEWEWKAAKGANSGVKYWV